jgi:hypothetical protein
MTEVDEHIFASLEKVLRDKYDFVADLDHFAIWGTCAKCQSKSRALKTSRRNG